MRVVRLVVVPPAPLTHCLSNAWIPTRLDPRLPSYKAQQAQRSINLAISSRGLAAIASVEPAMAARFLDTVIPMRGRMIHGPKGYTSPQIYDVHGQVRLGVQPSGFVIAHLALVGLVHQLN